MREQRNIFPVSDTSFLFEQPNLLGLQPIFDC